MADLVLKRNLVVSSGAFGELWTPGSYPTPPPLAVTLERTYSPDDPKVIGAIYHGQKIKIPIGTWPCKRRWFIRGGYWTYEVLVPEHTALLFHRGNLETDSEGCVLVAAKLRDFNGNPGIVGAVGLDTFLNWANERATFFLEVTE